MAYSHSQHWSLWEAAAARLSLADRYCSSPYWGTALVRAFHGVANLYVYRDGPDLAVFHELEVEGGRLVMPCDAMWTLGSPILAEDPAKFLASLCQYWESLSGVRQVTIGGLYADNPIWSSPVWRRYPHWVLAPAGRQVASLEGGADGFLSRRSVNFRSRLRRSVKKSEADGVQLELWPQTAEPEAVESLLSRALEIEGRSWKGLTGQGVNRGQMREFYRLMLPMLARGGRLRGLFLKRDGRDLCYLFGASFSGYFRGLQFSYLESEAEGLGNVAQWHMIEQMASEGCTTYDLGQAMAYKARWAESNIASRSQAFLLGAPSPT